MKVGVQPPPILARLVPPTVTPPPGPLPLHRFLPRFVRNPLRGLPIQVYEEPLVIYNSGRAVLVWVTDPALVETVLRREQESFPKTPLERRVFGPALGDGILTSTGPSWRWQRRVAAPLFRHQDILLMVPTMAGAAEEQIARWRARRPGSVCAIDRDMTDTTYAVVTRTVLAGCDAAEGEAIKRAGARFLDPISWQIAYALMRLPPWLWHPGRGKMRGAADVMRAAVASIVRRYRAEGGESHHLLGRLLAARDPDTGAPMSDGQLIDNLLTFLAAGHETTAKALTWTLYLLARAPEWQQRVREEALSVAGTAPIAAGHIADLSLTQQVLKEAMRLYPPAPVLTRVPSEDTELGGQRVRAGTMIVMPIFAIHRHRRLWRDPDCFDPERFAPEQEAGYARTQFMPFGFGPRSCIGMSFAMIETTAILATLVRAARFAWDGRHLPEPVSRVTLRPKGGMPLNVTPT